MRINKQIDKFTKKLTGGEDSNSEALLSILKNANWLAFENLFRTFVSLFVLVWVAQYLGPEKFGEYNYAFAFVTIFSVLGTLGMDPIVVRRLVNKKNSPSEILGSTFTMRMIGSIVMIVLALATAWATNSTDTQFLLFVAVFALSYALKPFEVIDYWFQSQVKAKFSVYARSTAFFIGSIVKIVLILTSSSLLPFVVVSLIEQTVAIIIFVYLYTKHTNISIFKWKLNWNIIAEIMKDSWPLTLGAIASIIYTRIDQVMIGSMLNNTELGYYFSAVKLSEATNFIPLAIASSVFPAIVNAKRKSQKLYEDRMQLLFDLIVWLGISVSLVISVGAPTIVKIFGDQYVNSGPVLQVHVWSSLFIFIGAIAARWVIAENLTKNALVRTVVAAILNIGLNMVLIPTMGIMGAAIATVISYAFVNFISLLFAKSTLPSFIMIVKAFNIFRVLGRLKK